MKHGGTPFATAAISIAFSLTLRNAARNRPDGATRATGKDLPGTWHSGA
jgi:hypothetical protein